MFLGVYGNADPEDISQVLHVSSPFDDNNNDNVASDVVVKSRLWIPNESRCQGIPTRLRYHFLWTHVGCTNNPQAKIIR